MHRHRPLHTYMDRNEHFGKYQISLTFLELLVTKPVATQGTTWYQMEDTQGHCLSTEIPLFTEVQKGEKPFKVEHFFEIFPEIE